MGNGREAMVAIRGLERFYNMFNLTRIAVVLGCIMLLQGCTAASSLFDNNCSGNSWMEPGEDYCADYTSGVGGDPLP